MHRLAEEATLAYESTREKIAKFINARFIEEIIFTRNATEAINLISYTWGSLNINQDDIVVITEFEHHSNIVPWQILTHRKGAHLKYIGVDDDGYLRLKDYQKYLESGRVKLVSISEMSNVLGTIVQLKEIIKMSS